MRLKLNETYIYYDFPILFSALDEGGNAFICLFAEETDSHLRYICVPISQSTFMELEHNQRDIRSLFIHPEKVINLLLNAESEEPVEVIETQEDITPFIPEKDLFIGKIQKELVQSVMLDEIDAMTPKEYWVLFNEAQNLPDFVPPGMDTDNFVSVQYNNILVTPSNTTFRTETNTTFLSVKETDIVFDGDSLWPIAA
jgi:hypothetical protein